MQMGQYLAGKVQRHTSNLDILHLKLADQRCGLIVKCPYCISSSPKQRMSPRKFVSLYHQSSDGVFINGNYKFPKCVKLAGYQIVLLVAISQAEAAPINGQFLDASDILLSFSFSTM